MGIEQSITLLAPAKLNLFLHVIGQRRDGYHELESVFRSVSLYDRITLSSRVNSSVVSLTAPEYLGDVSENLVVKAAKLLQRKSRATFGASIDLEKSIPVGAGLGGGSSDAAATLIGLNALWGLGYDAATLRVIGAELGADVPFFIEGQDAWVSGIGDVLSPINLPDAWYFLVFPNVFVPTAHIFSHPHLTRDTQPSKIARFLDAPLALSWKNDLENVVLGAFPEVEKLKNWLSRKGTAKMSGSGSSCFVEVASREAGEALAADLPNQWQGFVVSAGDVESLRSQAEALVGDPR